MIYQSLYDTRSYPPAASPLMYFNCKMSLSVACIPESSIKLNAVFSTECKVSVQSRFCMLMVSGAVFGKNNRKTRSFGYGGFTYLVSISIFQKRGTKICRECKEQNKKCDSIYYNLLMAW